MPDYTDSYEDVSKFTLAADREKALLDAQTECCFMWTARRVIPSASSPNYVVRDDRFWVTCTRRRKRVAAVSPPAGRSPSPAGARASASARPSPTGRDRRDGAETSGWMYRGAGRPGAPGERRAAGRLRPPPRHRGPRRHRDRAGRGSASPRDIQDSPAGEPRSTPATRGLTSPAPTAVGHQRSRSRSTASGLTPSAAGRPSSEP